MKAQPEGFFRTVRRMGIETPLKKCVEYLPAYAFAS